MKETVGVIGVGGFATHLIEGLMRSDPSLQMVLSPRNRDRAQLLSERFGLPVMQTNDEVVSASDLVLLCTRPMHVFDSVADLPWREEQIIVSVAAGITRAELDPYVAPAEVVLSMPTNSGMIGAAAIPMHPQNSKAQQLLSKLGDIMVIDDEKVFAAASTLGAYFGWLLALMQESTAWLERNGADPAQARQLMVKVFRSVADVVSHRDQHSLEFMVDELRIPGGLTEHGLKLFTESGAMEEWSKILDATHDRLTQRY